MEEISPLLANPTLFLGLAAFLVVFVVSYVGFVIYVVVSVHNKQASEGYTLTLEQFRAQQEGYYRKQGLLCDDGAGSSVPATDQSL